MRKFTVALGILAAAMVVLVVERSTPAAANAMLIESDARHALPPEELAYWRRHERNQALCRGQAWVSQCCDDAREDVTCLHPRNHK